MPTFQSFRESARREAEQCYRRCQKTAASALAPEQLLLGGGQSLPAIDGDARQQIVDAKEQYGHFRGQTFTSIRPIAQRIAGQPLRLARIAKNIAGRERRNVETRQYAEAELAAFVSKHLGRPIKAGEQLEVVDQHPILDALTQPAASLPGWNDWCLKYVTAASLELTGHAYWWFPVVKGRKEIWHLPTHWVRPKNSPTGLFQGWLLKPDGASDIEHVRPAVGRVACWTFDLLAEEFSPERFAWANAIAPACDLFATTDGCTAAKLPGAVVVRQGSPDEIDAEAGWPEEYEGDVLFLGMAYGERRRLVDVCFDRFGQRFRAINDCRGPERTRLVRSFRLVVGPHWPHFAGYWSNRIYIVAGHGGLFAAPPVEGMAAEGWRPSGNYLALPREPEAMVRKLDEYLRCDPAQLRAIQLAGYAHAREQCNYDRRVAELLTLLGHKT